MSKSIIAIYPFAHLLISLFAFTVLDGLLAMSADIVSLNYFADLSNALSVQRL